MMRANAATTRVVRGHLPDIVGAGLADALRPVCDVLIDPGRRLPDGRTVRELAAGADDFQVYTDQVRAFCDRCGKLVERLGSFEVVGALACYAAAACWKWWLAPGWPSIVDKIINSLQDATAQISLVACPTPASELNMTRIRQTLLAGPDRLSAQEARYCRLASLYAQLSQDHGLSPRSRRLLPPAHRNVVSYLASPAESFRQRLAKLYPIPVLGIPRQRQGTADGHDSA